MDSAQMMASVEETAWKLVDAGSSVKKLNSLFLEARERGRFGLRDVLLAFALAHSYPDHPWSGLSSPTFARLLADVFDPLDVDLWCMELVEDATPVAGQDVYGANETCATIVYGKNAYLCAMQDRRPVVVTYAKQRCRSGFLRMLEDREASELMARTVPIVLCNTKDTHVRGYDKHFAPFLQRCVLGPDSMRAMLAYCDVARLSIASVLQSDSAHCLANDANMAAMVLVSYQVCDDEFYACAQRTHDALRDNPGILFNALEKTVTAKEFCWRVICKKDQLQDLTTPTLCGMLDNEHRLRMRGVLTPLLEMRNNYTFSGADYRLYIDHVREAISACNSGPKSAACD